MTELAEPIVLKRRPPDAFRIQRRLDASDGRRIGLLCSGGKLLERLDDPRVGRDEGVVGGDPYLPPLPDRGAAIPRDQ